MKAKILIILLLSFGLYCCGGAYSKNALQVGAPGTVAPPVDQEYRINVGDKLSVRLFYNPDLNQEITVRPDGKISLQLVHELDVIGKTPSELTAMLNEKYSKFLQEPELVVIVNAFAGHKVYVGGEVSQPGAKEIVGPTTILNAITLAGGFKDTARLNEVILVRREAADQPPFLVKLDLDKAMRGIDVRQDVYVQPYDMVLVPKSNIADVDLWVAQYVHAVIGSPEQLAVIYSLGK